MKGRARHSVRAVRVLSVCGAEGTDEPYLCAPFVFLWQMIFVQFVTTIRASENRKSGHP